MTKHAAEDEEREDEESEDEESEDEESEDRTKRVTLRLTWDCPADTPAHVLTWMANNLREYAANEFGHDYDADFVDPPFEGPPLKGDVDVDINDGASPELIAPKASV